MSTEQAGIILLASEDGDALCYLCLDGGSMKLVSRYDATVLVKGNDAGFVYLSCLTNYAMAKNKGWVNDMDQFIKPVCPNCHKMYQNELAIDIATEYVSFAYNT
jgi:hypothetical protein